MLPFAVITCLLILASTLVYMIDLGRHSGDMIDTPLGMLCYTLYFLIPALCALYFIIQIEIIPFQFVAMFALGCTATIICDSMNYVTKYKTGTDIFHVITNTIAAIFFVSIVLFHYNSSLSDSVEQLIPGFFNGVK